MNKIKSSVVWIATILIIAIWNIPGIIAPYTWSEKVIMLKEKDGWVLASSSRNAASLVEPWTIFNAPVSQLVFIKKKQLKEINPNIYQAKILYVNYENFTRTQEEEFEDLVDCQRRQMGYIDKSMKLEDVEWKSYEKGQPGEKIMSFICNK